METFFENIFARLQEIFNSTSLGARVAEWLADFIVFTLTFLVFYLLWLVVKRLARPALKRANLDETTLTIGFAARDAFSNLISGFF